MPKLVSIAFIFIVRNVTPALLWRHNGRDGVLNHQPQHCLLDRLFSCSTYCVQRFSSKTALYYVVILLWFVVYFNSETDEFPAQMASNAENVSIWWRHHGPTILRGMSIKRNGSYRGQIKYINDSKLCHYWFIWWLVAPVFQSLTTWMIKWSVFQSLITWIINMDYVSKFDNLNNKKH